MSFDLSEARNNVKRALQLTSEWRKSAKEDYDFMRGKQWTDADLKVMKQKSRPVITINRIRPVINLLSGYAAQNETEPDFLPRSEEDDRVARVAKGITKYTFDKTNYQSVKKKHSKTRLSVASEIIGSVMNLITHGWMDEYRSKTSALLMYLWIRNAKKMICQTLSTAGVTAGKVRIN